MGPGNNIIVLEFTGDVDEDSESTDYSPNPLPAGDDSEFRRGYAQALRDNHIEVGEEEEDLDDEEEDEDEDDEDDEDEDED